MAKDLFCTCEAMNLIPRARHIHRMWSHGSAIGSPVGTECIILSASKQTYVCIIARMRLSENKWAKQAQLKSLSPCEHLGNELTTTSMRPLAGTINQVHKLITKYVCGP